MLTPYVLLFGVTTHLHIHISHVKETHYHPAVLESNKRRVTGFYALVIHTTYRLRKQKNKNEKEQEKKRKKRIMFTDRSVF